MMRFSAEAVSVAEAVPVPIACTKSWLADPTATGGVIVAKADEPAVWAGAMLPIVVVPLRTAYLMVPARLDDAAVTTPAILHTKVASATGRYRPVVPAGTWFEAVAIMFCAVR